MGCHHTAYSTEPLRPSTKYSQLLLAGAELPQSIKVLNCGVCGELLTRSYSVSATWNVMIVDHWKIVPLTNGTDHASPRCEYCHD